MKKKVLSLCMAAALVLGSGTAAMAETVKEKDTSVSREVKGTYQQMAAPETVYKVDVAWGSMEFTYHAPDTIKKWNPEKHEYVYEKKIDGEWRTADGANKITITNSSNKAITAKIDAKVTSDEIFASVTNSTIDLDDASIGATTEAAGKASTGEASIDLTGALSDTTANKTKIGTVTVSFEDTVTVQP